MTEREFATDVVARLQNAGFEALFAGGCVRDELLGIEPADFDIATSATPDQVKQHFKRCHSFGASFGVVEVLGPRDPHGEWLKVQVATFRSDGTYTDGRRPDTVVFSSPEEDAARRDFTINGLFRDPITGKVFDFVGGERDLRNKVLRAIGDPAKRFEEDKLRILRAVRMTARFELTIDPATLAAAKAMAPLIAAVSAERIAEELRKILTNEHRVRGVRLLGEFGLLPHILPELMNVERAAETLVWLESGGTSSPSSLVAGGRCHHAFCLALTAILPQLDHPQVISLVSRLKLSNEERDRIAWLNKHRQSLVHASELPRSILYPVLAHPGNWELVALHLADARTNHLEPGGANFCERVLQNVSPEILNPLPFVTGDDLVAMGMKPGREFKRILDTIRNLQLDGELTTPEEAKQKAQKLSNESAR